eukprot:m.494868 g.494868  ORF g.494868 m.494868 type:complete len:326 (-) comp42109_c0_seq1:104-1081(-)
MAVVFGTMPAGVGEEAAVYDTTKQALAAGFRHLDCAEMYNTAQHVGRAIADTPGLVPTDVHITLKVTGLPTGPFEEVRARVEKLLGELGVERVGYLLFHFPGPRDLNVDGATPESVAVRAPLAWFRDHVGEAWRNMLRLRDDAGLAKAVGTSNCYQKHLEILVEQFPDAAQQPAVNQVFVDAVHQEADLLAWQAARGIKAMSYRPVAFCAGYAMLGEMGDPFAAALDRAAAACEGCTSTHQYVLAGLVQRGVSVCTSSTNPDHLKASLAAASLAQQQQQGDGDMLSCLPSSDMAVPCGLTDEFAAAWRTIGGAERVQETGGEASA